MGKGGGGGGSPAPTQQTVTQTNLPEYAKPYFENIMQRAQAESYRPYQAYSGQRLAGFEPGQVTAQQEVAGMQTPGQFGGATAGLTAGTMQGLGAGQAGMGMAFQDPSTMMSPYMQNVVDVQKAQAIRDAQQANLAQNLSSARQGTYGGARQMLAQSERERNLQTQLGNIQASGLQNAYTAAAQRGQQLGQLGLGAMQAGMTGAQALGQLGTAQQTADLQRIQAQSAMGAEQRAFEQQKMDQAYADFMRQRDYPMEMLGYYSNLLRGVPVGLGSTATTYAQPPSLASQVVGPGLLGLGLYKEMNK